jgi:hypothetical protein
MYLPPTLLPETLGDRLDSQTDKSALPWPLRRPWALHAYSAPSLELVALSAALPYLPIRRAHHLATQERTRVGSAAPSVARPAIVSATAGLIVLCERNTTATNSGKCSRCPAWAHTRCRQSFSCAGSECETAYCLVCEELELVACRKCNEYYCRMCLDFDDGDGRCDYC